MKLTAGGTYTMTGTKTISLPWYMAMRRCSYVNKKYKLRFIDEKNKGITKRLERIWKISSIIWNCGFCDFCVISIILLYFIDFKFLSKWLWIFMEEVTYNYKTCDRWWQNRRNFMFRSHKKSFWFYKASFAVIWILLQYRGRNWSSLNSVELKLI